MHYQATEERAGVCSLSNNFFIKNKNNTSQIQQTLKKTRFSSTRLSERPKQNVLRINFIQGNPDFILTYI